MDEASSFIHPIHQDEMWSAERGNHPRRVVTAGAQATPPDLGSDSAMPVSDDFGPGSSVFTGRVRLVQIDSPPKTWTI